jgi:hypothetical protein
MPYRADNVDLLLPAFAVKTRQVLAKLKDMGHSPVPFDTLRTQAEAEKFFIRGVGSRNSMHLYGIACDVICDKHGWGCGDLKCSFFQDLGLVVEGLGLVWGGRFKQRHDLPHFQGCGASAAEQARVRALGWDARNAYVEARLCKP